MHKNATSSGVPTGLALALGGGCLVLAILLVWALMRQPGEGNAFGLGNAGGPNNDQALAEQLRRIDARLERLESGSLAQPSDRDPIANAQRSSDYIAKMKQDREQSRAFAADRQRTRRMQDDTNFAIAPAAGAKQRQAAQKLTTAMLDKTLLADNAPPDSHNIQCRGGLCRMEFIFSDLAAADDWADFYPVHTARYMKGIRTYREKLANGQTVLVIYGDARP